MHVTIYLNHATDGDGRMAGLDGFQEGHPLARAFDFEVPGDLHVSSPEGAADVAWEVGNAPADMTDFDDLVRAYRAAEATYPDGHVGGLRSVSVGDVLEVTDGEDTTWLACAARGWTPIPEPTESLLSTTPA